MRIRRCRCAAAVPGSLEHPRPQSPAGTGIPVVRAEARRGRKKEVGGPCDMGHHEGEGADVTLPVSEVRAGGGAGEGKGAEDREGAEQGARRTKGVQAPPCCLRTMNGESVAPRGGSGAAPGALVPRPLIPGSARRVPSMLAKSVLVPWVRSIGACGRDAGGAGTACSGSCCRSVWGGREGWGEGRGVGGDNSSRSRRGMRWGGGSALAKEERRKDGSGKKGRHMGGRGGGG